MAEHKKKLSVILPTHNRPQQLERCLNALSHQDLPGRCFEVIIIDDGSRMPLDNPVSRFKNVFDIVLIRQDRKGPAAARNKGAQIARGRYLVFTDDDCVPLKHWLSTIVKGFEKNPGCLVGGKTIILFPENNYSTASQLIIDFLYDEYNKDPENAKFFTSNNFAVQAKDFQELLGFAAESFPFAGGEDRDFCARWLSQGRRMVYVPAAQVYHGNDLTLRSFIRQQYYYGRAARQYKRKMHGIAIPVKTTGPISFYKNLVLYPLKKKQGKNAVLQVFLLFLSQIFIVCGFCYEGIRSGSIQKQKVI